MVKNIEAEGNELVLTNNNGSTAIIPKNKRAEVLKHLKANDHSKLDDLISNLPRMMDYAEDGSYFPYKGPKGEVKAKKNDMGGGVVTNQEQFDKTFANIDLQSNNSIQLNDIKMNYTLEKDNTNVKNTINPLEKVDIGEEQNILPEMPTSILSQEDLYKKPDMSNFDLSGLEDVKSVDKKFNELKSQYKKENLNFVKSKDYKSKIDISTLKSKADIMKVQELLKIDYDLGKYGKNKDGVDGYLGKMTKHAIEEYNKSLSNKVERFTIIKGNNVECKEDQCAAFVQGELHRAINSDVSIDDFINKLGIKGDAWNISKNIIKNGGELIFNAKDNVDRSGIKRQKGDVVSMYTGGRSNYQDQANEKGDGNTHTGFISKVYDDGSYDVQHNVHSVKGLGIDGVKYTGHKYTNHVTAKGIMEGKYAGFVINKITRPKYENIDIKDVSINKENVIVDNGNRKASSSVVSYFNDNKEQLAKSLKTTEEETMMFATAALGIIEQESKFGESDKFIAGRETYETTVTMAKGLKAAFTEKEYGKDIEASQSLARVKIDMNFDKFNKQDIKNLIGDDIDNDNGALVMTMKILHTNYKKALRKGYSEKEALYRAIAAHNSPRKAFDNKKGSYASRYDIDYANKVLLNATSFKIKNRENEMNTKIDEILNDDKILSNISKIKSVYNN